VRRALERALVCRSGRRQENARLIVSQIILDTLKGLQNELSKDDDERAKNCWKSASSSQIENKDR